MDIDLRIIHYGEFLQTTPEGEIDLESSKKILGSLASLTRPPHRRAVLLDLRGVTPRLGIMDITRVVAFMQQDQSAYYFKMAVLTSPGPNLELAKFFEVYAQNRSFQVTAFDDFESAILWLSGSELTHP